MTLKKIISRLKKVGFGATFDEGILCVDGAGILPFFNEQIRRLLYFLLNKFESDCFIRIKGLPYCFLPDACDHVIYPEKKSSRYKKYAICRTCRFKRACPGLLLQPATLKISLSPVPDGPEDLAIEVNSSCNLRCRFCHHAHRGKRQLSFSRIKEVLEEARLAGVRSVRFTGGEPLLREDMPKILGEAKSKGFLVFLNTNATLINDDLLSRIEKNVDNILISLCGYNVATENTINQKGAGIDVKFRNILKIARSGIPVKRLGSVISHLLIDDFDKYAVVVSRLGIKSWELYRPMASTHGSKDKLYDIGKQDYLKLFDKMISFKKSGLNVTVANALPFCITRRKVHLSLMRGARFDDGHDRLVLDARGFFKPSYFLEIGLGRTLSRAWNYPYMKEIRKGAYLPENCLRCIYATQCLGGSRFLAKQVFGTYRAPDPLCVTA